MSDEPPSSQKQSEKSWLRKLLNTFTNEPTSRAELLTIIKEAAERNLFDQEALHIIEGALEVSDQRVHDILVPRSKMVVVRIEETPEQFLPRIIESGHSRFPVIEESTDNVRGILLAKDLLPLVLGGKDEFSLETIIRPANVIPESKRLNILLREFRENRYHMAMVLDEYGGISGLVTIEDILEEIVGEIEDETDEEDHDTDIRKLEHNAFVVRALTPVDDFNAYFNSGFPEDEFDTIGGVVLNAFGHLAKRNESVTIDGYSFTVLYSDSRKLHLLRVTPPEEQ
ncbi:HlyC/CorC family transporter [Simiduia aestuariiviva]|uniref:Magnesium and cobalt efflux protein CorC n=1 Tax=Simiduia aestuariiviva TaxID=1510459 RepID=A0A839UV12_9GAMM|nr:transporter associated domain-containing protein [Simiduia aestuariiviva]MBB3169207.1 magnesium and cobalt transporter [Simiduia aestuariiviva]